MLVTRWLMSRLYSVEIVTPNRDTAEIFIEFDYLDVERPVGIGIIDSHRYITVLSLERFKSDNQFTYFHTSPDSW